MSKKTVALVLSLVSVFSMSACQFDRGDSSERDPDKTYLKVGVYNGDLGYDWLQQVAADYQAANPDVIIEFDPDKDRFNAGNLLLKMDDYRNDVYFVNGIDYQTFISQDKLADITDIVATNNIEGENETIANKLNPALKDYFNKGTETAPKYYALPYFEGIFGTVYDVDLFEEFGFYYNTNGNLIMLDQTNTELSVGPNGIDGDFDDGLPATYTEWKNLLYWLDQSGFLPYMWNKDDFYRQRWMTSHWADYEGKENFDLNLSFNGSYKFVGDEEATPITIENGYLLQKQQGKKYALEIAEHIISKGYYDSESFDDTFSMAQQEYLLSVEKAKEVQDAKRAAMFIEGSWWENGCKAFFRTMADTYKNTAYAYGNRRFGFMPTPKADDGSSATGTTLVSSTGSSAAFVWKNTDKLELAKDFLQFAHSDAALRTFTRVTGAIRPYDYTIGTTEKSEMTNFAQSLWDIYHSQNTKICHISLFEHESFSAKTSFLGSGSVDWWWKSTVGNNRYEEALFEMDRDTNLTAEKYFTGLQTTYSKTNWDAEMKEYFNK